MSPIAERLILPDVPSESWTTNPFVPSNSLTLIIGGNPALVPYTIKLFATGKKEDPADTIAISSIPSLLTSPKLSISTPAFSLLPTPITVNPLVPSNAEIKNSLEKPFLLPKIMWVCPSSKPVEFVL